jgi:hypothetical protein
VIDWAKEQISDLAILMKPIANRNKRWLDVQVGELEDEVIKKKYKEI